MLSWTSSFYTNEILGRSNSFSGHFQSLVNFPGINKFGPISHQIFNHAQFKPSPQLLAQSWLRLRNLKPIKGVLVCFSLFPPHSFSLSLPHSFCDLWLPEGWLRREKDRHRVEKVFGEGVVVLRLWCPLGMAELGIHNTQWWRYLRTLRAAIHHQSHSGCHDVFECVYFIVSTAFLFCSPHTLGGDQLPINVSVTCYPPPRPSPLPSDPRHQYWWSWFSLPNFISYSEFLSGFLVCPCNLPPLRLPQPSDISLCMNPRAL